MSKLLSKNDGKKEVRSKRLLTEAFFDLLFEYPGKPISVKDLCERADYARPTFYAHFNQIQDVPYQFYKKDWLEGFREKMSFFKKEELQMKDIIKTLSEMNFNYWATQVDRYRMLKSVEMDCVFMKLFEEATSAMHEEFHHDYVSFKDSMSGKCIIRGYAQLTFVIYDIWAYSGRKMDVQAMTSSVLQIMDSTSGITEKR